MEVRTKPFIEWGVATFALAGASLPGDRHVVLSTPKGVLVGVVDGLGHGQEAAAAADIAVATLCQHAEEAIIGLFQQCHERLHRTRGVVMSLASFTRAHGTMTWMGIGNVEGFVFRASATVGPRYSSLLLRGGVVGSHLPPLYASSLSVMPGDTLIFSTDGIRSDYAEGLSTAGRPQQIADSILARYSKGSDDALVLIARYIG